MRALAARSWRPQDVRAVEDITAIIEAWSVGIDQLLRPARRWSLPAACPACNVAVVYRNHGGERVRQPALQVGADGCICQNCKTVWALDKFVFLSRLLGCLLDNVLE